MSVSYLELCEAHHRRSVRLKNHDYTRGTYFVTICAKNGEHLLGEIVHGEMRLSEYGRIANECWYQTPQHFPFATLDAFVIMPNHVHGILLLHPYSRGTPWRAPTSGRTFRSMSSGSLPTIINHFKSAVTRRIRALPEGYEGHFWQRNYHEHIIKKDAELAQVCRYILENPSNWEKDNEDIK